MARKKSQSLLTWLLWHPLKFALIAFGLIVLISAVLNAMGVSTDGPIAFGVIIAVVIAAAITFWYMPRGNMDRRGFIALNNAQTLIATTIFWASAIIIATYQAQITNKLLWMATMQSGMFFTIFVLVGVFYMYLFGVSLTNLYTKYQRCREMGMSPWHIILSMPFGFSLIWIPGYMLPDNTRNTTPAVSVNTRWYTKLTNLIISNPIYTTLVFALLTLFSRYFYGTLHIVITLSSALIYMLWFRFAGLSSFRQHQTRAYAYTAIAINITLIVVFGIMAYDTISSLNMTQINITDVPPVPQP